MFFDVDNPPDDPPSGCQHRLLWRLARALWDAHTPDGDGFCLASPCRRDNHLSPCPATRLAAEGMQTACGETVPTSPQWIAITRARITAGEIDPVDAIAELLWHHHQRRAGK
ncbi:hypothetical protein SAMN05444365_104417 [Micromonospora pattaloongensis]|uniref:Uncharacterized protein n=1 Tax=Micromonospora pattaloongensis TaxID=405436 RepID=A0A1H3PAH5_9ACTN|nr:hypothetical protein [Micromonospora pattaloongensis]SDY98126.1 hypothetical protein SAMN05444365_104417 [Micromonospora pattaloongensis]